MSLHTWKRVPPPFASAQTQDKLPLGKLCSGAAAYFKLSGDEMVPTTAKQPIPWV